MNFQNALTLMQGGRKVTREAWKDPKVVAFIEKGFDAPKLYKVIQCNVGPYTHAKLGWHPTNNDILADDWKLA